MRVFLFAGGAGDKMRTRQPQFMAHKIMAQLIRAELKFAKFVTLDAQRRAYFRFTCGHIRR